MSAPSSPNVSAVRQNYHEKSEAAINRQVNLQFYASYVYMSMAYYFDRDDVALPGFHKYFKKLSDEERERAHDLMKYQNARGGRILLKDIAKPEKDEWDSSLSCLESSLSLAKNINTSMLEVHALASSNADAHLTNYLEGEHLERQVNVLKTLGDHVTSLKRAGPGSLGEYVFDKDLKD